MVWIGPKRHSKWFKSVCDVCGADPNLPCAFGPGPSKVFVHVPLVGLMAALAGARPSCYLLTVLIGNEHA